MNYFLSWSKNRIKILFNDVENNDRLFEKYAKFQAFGRTARQGKKGTVRIICMKEEYVSACIEFNIKEIEAILKDFQYKKDVQLQYIEHFRKSRGWIFDSRIGPQNISDNYIHDMRELILM
ncbi:hypothetical protein M9Y10_041905 [Tritrichomonas musculus]|uniref:Uncharacterized protein n=1 Tax=Tritrichomonas musculus TaxID=1915356 RepID=A0ABR2K7H0_9EUKA